MTSGGFGLTFCTLRAVCGALARGRSQTKEKRRNAASSALFYSGLILRLILGSHAIFDKKLSSAALALSPRHENVAHRRLNEKFTMAVRARHLMNRHKVSTMLQEKRPGEGLVRAGQRSSHVIGEAYA